MYFIQQKYVIFMLSKICRKICKIFEILEKIYEKIFFTYLNIFVVSNKYEEARTSNFNYLKGGSFFATHRKLTHLNNAQLIIQTFVFRFTLGQKSNLCPKIGLLMKTCPIANLNFRAKRSIQKVKRLNFHT